MHHRLANFWNGALVLTLTRAHLWPPCTREFEEFKRQVKDGTT